jgi:hypothetical protein
MYKQLKNIDGSIDTTMIQRVQDKAFIPFNTDNSDYQAYLKWLAEGNAPESADE